MPELGFGKKSDFDLKIASLGPPLVRFLVEIWSDKSLILKFLSLIFCLAALQRQKSGPRDHFRYQVKCTGATICFVCTTAHRATNVC